MGKLNISIESISSSLLKEAARLYEHEPHKVDIWPWQFTSRFGRLAQAIVARDDGVLVGFNATMPIELYFPSQEVVSATWSCDFIVDQKYRGQGVGSHMKDVMLASMAKPIMSLGISDSAFPILLKKGGVSPAELFNLQAIFKPKNWKQFVAQFLGNFLRLISSIFIKDRKEIYSCKRIYNIPDEKTMSLLWLEHTKINSGIEVVKSFEYLTWRYQQCPYSVYMYVGIYSDDGSLAGLLIYRVSTEKYIEISEFIGDFSNFSLIEATVSYLFEHYSNHSFIQWNTSSKILKKNLILNGFIKKSYSTRFVSIGSVGVSHDVWNLSSGDSDGGFLSIGRELNELCNQPVLPNFDLSNDACVFAEDSSLIINKKIGIQKFLSGSYAFNLISEDEFNKANYIWDELLGRSCANGLFLSWSWQISWWKIWSKKLNLTLSIYLIYLDDEVVGILPLYYYKKALVTYYQFLGNAWGVSPTVRSEYIAPIFDEKCNDSLKSETSKFFSWLNRVSTIIIPDSIDKNVFDLKFLTRRKDFGYRIGTDGSFEDYKNILGSMTRLKAFNRREYLCKTYKSVEKIDVVLSGEAISDFFSKLNAFHLLRWGVCCFDKDAIAFHKSLIAQLKDSIRLSYISVDHKIISASYNILVGSEMYNIQSGYLEGFDKKISMGTLHMGWVIEECFLAEGISHFNFLAGEGKSENYKTHYGGEEIYFYTLQLFPSPLVYWIYYFGWKFKKLLTGFFKIL